MPKIIADDNVQPMEKAGIGIIRIVLMIIVFQCGDVTAVAITANRTALGKGNVGKFLHGRLLEIGGHPHFQKLGIAMLIQRQCHESLSLFCAPAPLLTVVGPPKYESSNSMTPFSRCVSSRCPIAVRMRLSMNQAVL